MFKLLKDFLGWTPSSGVRSPSSSALLFPNTGQRMGKQVTRMHVNLSACVQPGWAYMAYLRILERFVWGESSIFHLVRHPRTDAIRVAMVVLSTKASTWSKQGHHGREEVPTADARSILFFDASIQAANLWPALLVCFESFPAKSWLNFTSLPWIWESWCMNGSQAEYVRGNKADQKVYADWDQEKWLAEHTLRRSTQKGLHVHCAYACCVDFTLFLFHLG